MSTVMRSAYPSPVTSPSVVESAVLVSSVRTPFGVVLAVDGQPNSHPVGHPFHATTSSSFLPPFTLPAMTLRPNPEAPYCGFGMDGSPNDTTEVNPFLLPNSTVTQPASVPLPRSSSGTPIARSPIPSPLKSP